MGRMYLEQWSIAPIARISGTKLIKSIRQPFSHRDFGAPEATAFNKVTHMPSCQPIFFPYCTLDSDVFVKKISFFFCSIFLFQVLFPALSPVRRFLLSIIMNFKLFFFVILLPYIWSQKIVNKIWSVLNVIISICIVYTLFRNKRFMLDEMT